jgi:DNA-binding winged helix-turn-helix (wHTH) protein
MRVFFADFVLDRATRQLLRDGKERHLEPKAFELLDFLLDRRPEAVAKTDILERLWPGTFVSESSLTRLVAQVRRGLGDDPRRARFVRTVHRFGYAFSADVFAEPASKAGEDRVAGKVSWEDQLIPLKPGQNVLGRDEEVTVRINAPGVSRRHARIVADGGRFTLEDLGSKNGTYLREQRLEGPAALEDGDAFRLGRTILVFSVSRNVGTTVIED